MPIDRSLLEQLLHEGEGPALDFKRDQYPFSGADQRTKSELLKDILAFSNSWRRATAYILIGVEEVRGGRGRIVGTVAHLNDAHLQQFVNSKTNRDVDFSYQIFGIDGVEIGVIEIPVQRRPTYSKTDYGKVKKEAVYKRVGSSTKIASPDEIAHMGAEQVLDTPPQFSLEWANLQDFVVLPSPCAVKTLFLHPLLPENTFEDHDPRSFQLIHSYGYNKNYSKEMIWYIHRRAFLESFGLRLRNLGGVVGKRVLFVGSIAKDNTLEVLRWSQRPTPPPRNNMYHIPNIVPLAQQLQNNPDPRVVELPDRWEVTVDFGDIRPQDEIWTTSALIIGSRDGITKLEGELRGDNIPKPISFSLEINFEVEKRPMKRSDVEPFLHKS